MNLDFTNHPGFTTYVLLLMFSGAVMLFLSSIKGSSNGIRAFNAIFGVGFIGYGFYLAFLFQGGSYIIFFKAFILPVILAFKTFQSRTAARRPAPPLAAQGTGPVAPPPPMQMPAHWPAPSQSPPPVAGSPSD